MARIAILDPTASPPQVDADPGPRLDPAVLSGGRFGIRYDRTWRSFDWVRDEWSQLLHAEGARVTEWCAGDRTGEAAEETLGELRSFARDQEVVVSGLGN
ncbi:MAG: hypothetical protein CL908_26600 [Deltaproteobacteria bacterium]|nr:hypothetical protein [Deltaproteobacteria bacterium]